MKNIRKFEDLQSFKEVYGKNVMKFTGRCGALPDQELPAEYVGHNDDMIAGGSYEWLGESGKRYFTKNRNPEVGDMFIYTTQPGQWTWDTYPYDDQVVSLDEFSDGVDYNFNGFVFDLAQMRTADTSTLFSVYDKSFKMLSADRKIVSLYDPNPFDIYDDIYEYSFDINKSTLQNMDLTFKATLVNYKSFDPNSQEDEVEVTFTEGGSGSGWYSYYATVGNTSFYLFCSTWPWGITPRDGEQSFFLTYGNQN